MEIVGGQKSRLILRAYAENEESLIGFYYCILDEIEKRTAVKDYIEDEVMAGGGGPAAQELGESFVEEATKAVPAKECVTEELCEIEVGNNYIIFEEKTDKCFTLFSELTKQGNPGLCITTTFPKKIAKKYDMENTDLYWLSEAQSDGNDTLNPKRLEFEIARVTNSFIKDKEDSLLILDGFEYLVMENGFEKVMKFLKKMNDLASMHGSTVILPLSSKSLNSDQMSILTKAFNIVKEIN
jgi:hypothetical protein